MNAANANDAHFAEVSDADLAEELDRLPICGFCGHTNKSKRAELEERRNHEFVVTLIGAGAVMFMIWGLFNFPLGVGCGLIACMAIGLPMRWRRHKDIERIKQLARARARS